jgi:ubiquitin-activating enzyme E1 C
MSRFINDRCPWMKVTPHFGDIQQKSASWYESFQCIIAGLDSVEARRWLNAMVCSLVKFDDDGDPDPTTIVPVIDGGSEAFKGQVRVILPRITSCFECSLDSFPPQRLFPLCTIAETPRLPEHCISYAFMLEVIAAIECTFFSFCYRCRSLSLLFPVHSPHRLGFILVA